MRIVSPFQYFSTPRKRTANPPELLPSSTPALNMNSVGKLKEKKSWNVAGPGSI